MIFSSFWLIALARVRTLAVKDECMLYGPNVNYCSLAVLSDLTRVSDWKTCSKGG